MRDVTNFHQRSAFMISLFEHLDFGAKTDSKGLKVGVHLLIFSNAIPGSWIQHNWKCINKCIQITVLEK